MLERREPLFFFFFLLGIKKLVKDSSLLEEVKKSEQDHVAQMQQPHVQH